MLIPFGRFLVMLFQIDKFVSDTYYNTIMRKVTFYTKKVSVIIFLAKRKRHKEEPSSYEKTENFRKMQSTGGRKDAEIYAEHVFKEVVSVENQVGKHTEK